MDRTRLVEGRITPLNKGLLAFRAGLYTVLGLGVLASQIPHAIGLACAVAVLAIAPATPSRVLERRRIELGIGISLVLESALWWRYGGVPGAAMLPVFSCAVGGLLLSQRAARSITTIAVLLQAAGIMGWAAGLVPAQTTAVELAARMVLLLATGLGFIGIGSVLRDYQTRIAEKSREEVRLTELIEEKDRLIDSVAHEIRTPLTAVLGFSSELADTGAGMRPADIRMLSELVAGESRRLARIVDNLVVGARSDISRLGCVIEPVDARRAVEDAWARAGCDSNLLTVEGSALVAADRTRLGHLFDNLIDNTIRHGEPPARIAIDPGTVSTVIRYADSGTGIPADIEHAVFDRYHAGRDRNRPDNLGLGLPVARALARNMGGDIKVEKSQLVVTLPTARAAIGASL